MKGIAELLESQERLQSEADAVVQMLRLEQLLSPLGKPVRVGSSAMGLMVRRDIDITVISPRLDAVALSGFSDVAVQLMHMTASVGSVRFRNDCGDWNKEPDRYPDGLYLGLTTLHQSSAVWTLDIWLVDEPERQPDLAHLQTLLPRINRANREAILRIKWVLAERPKSDSSVPSALVYEAVVDHDIRTIEQFDSWCSARR